MKLTVPLMSPLQRLCFLCSEPVHYISPIDFIYICIPFDTISILIHNLITNILILIYDTV